jgi:hypothetical protein
VIAVGVKILIEQQPEEIQQSRDNLMFRLLFPEGITGLSGVIHYSALVIWFPGLCFSSWNRTILKWILKKYVDLYIGFHGVRYKPVAGSVLQGNNDPEVNYLSEEATAHLLE